MFMVPLHNMYIPYFSIGICLCVRQGSLIHSVIPAISMSLSLSISLYLSLSFSFSFYLYLYLLEREKADTIITFHTTPHHTTTNFLSAL